MGRAARFAAFLRLNKPTSGAGPAAGSSFFRFLTCGRTAAEVDSNYIASIFFAVRPQVRQSSPSRTSAHRIHAVTQ